MSERHLAVNRTPVIQSLIRQWPICIEWYRATWISTQRSNNVHTIDAAGAERVRCSCWECGDDIGGCGVVWIEAPDTKGPSIGLYSNDEHHCEQQRDPTFGPESTRELPLCFVWEYLPLLSYLDVGIVIRDDKISNAPLRSC
jgi:hypothetical protein